MSPFEMNWRHLRATGLLISHRNLTSAAAAAGLSQPALTKGLAKLERQVGRMLFVRRPNGLEPTPEGSALAERVARAGDHLAAATALIARRGGGRGREALMTAAQLRAMLLVADAGGFAAAHLASSLSEPALHRAVRELELIVGVPLAERRGRAVHVTLAGRRLARGIRLATREIAAGLAEAAGAHGPPGPIVVGAMPLARARVLPLAAAAMQREYRDATIEIVEGSWRELVESLRDGRLDLMIGALRDTVDGDLVQCRLFEDNLVVVGGARHPLAGTRPSVARLAEFPWIVAAPGTPLLAQWQTLFHRRPAPRAPIICGSTVAIRTMLAESELLTLLSPDQVAIEVAAGLLAVIGSPLPHTIRQIGIVTRADWRPTSDRLRLLDLLRQYSDGGLPEMA